MPIIYLLNEEKIELKCMFKYEIRLCVCDAFTYQFKMALTTEHPVYFEKVIVSEKIKGEE